MTTLRPLLLAGAAAILTGCGHDLTVLAPPTPDQQAPGTSTRPGGRPPAGGASLVDEQKQRGEWDLVLTGVRTGRHDDFDRVVLDLAGTGQPGWRVEYVDEAVAEGTGDVVSMGGDAVLQVVASGTTYPVERGPSYVGPRRLPVGGVVVDVYVVGTTEGYTQLFVGVAEREVPFRVSVVPDPTRLVVDVGRGA